MPIYEFYCAQCHTIYKFFSRTVNTEKVPDCPKCQSVRLERKPSTFAALSGHATGEGEDDSGVPPIDEGKMEKAMAMLAREADGLDEDDPRQAASLMRKLSEATGLKMGPGMEEAMRRLERGEDPDKIEEEMGDLLEEEDPFVLEEKRSASRARSAPRSDDTLYDL